MTRIGGMFPESLRRLTLEIADFVFASTCVGCGAAGTALCPDCGRRLAPYALRLRSAGPPLRAGLTFDGVAAAVLRAIKEDGQTSLVRALLPALTVAVHDLPGAAAEVAVPVPTTRAAFRRRGYRVPDLLARGTGLPVLRVLRHARHLEDQRGLTADQRRRNLAGGLRAAGPGDGIRALVVDDVITTGATCAEAARALGAAGFTVVGAVAAAATERRR